jgi:hypothetical protein
VRGEHFIEHSIDFVSIPHARVGILRFLGRNAPWWARTCIVDDRCANAATIHYPLSPFSFLPLPAQQVSQALLQRLGCIFMGGLGAGGLCCACDLPDDPAKLLLERIGGIGGKILG